MSPNASRRRPLLASLVVCASMVTVVSVVASGSLALGSQTVVRPSPSAGDVGRGGDDAIPIAPQSISSGDEDYALSLNGTSQYAISTGSGVGIPSSPTSDLTAMAWVKPSAACSADCTIAKVDGTWSLFLTSTGVKAGVWSSGWREATATLPVPVDAWTHVAVAYDNSARTIFLYVNGQPVPVTQPSGLGNLGLLERRMSIGASDHQLLTSAPSPFSYGPPGAVDEVKVFGSLLDQADIESLMHSYGMESFSNPLVYYDFNEGPAETTGSGTVYNRVSGASSASNLRTVGDPTYTDITEITNNGNNTVVTFPRSYLTAAGGWRIPEGVSSLEYLVVAGGGGGGSHLNGGGGGGGAGGLRTSFNGGTALAVSSSTGPLGITVGAGGQRGIATSSDGSAGGSGGSSAIYGAGMTSVEAQGGGGGAGSIADYSGISGGSGGGALGSSTRSGDGGAGVAGQGHAGGANNPGATRRPAGGGGGAGSAGGPGSAAVNSISGDGGNGLEVAITGESIYYAGGGGGGRGRKSDGSNYYSAPGSGGLGGGGDGGYDGTAGINGLGGGGGGGGTSSGRVGGAGGSGIVIVSYNTDSASCEPFESTYIDGGTVYRVLKWSDPAQTGCTWTPPTGVTAVDVLLVAGGGSGGHGGRAGGGGAGQMVEYSGFPMTSDQAVSVAVGDGGNGQLNEAGRPGGDSIFGRLLAKGGGGGGGSATNSLRVGQDGGSGGGGAEGYPGEQLGQGGQAVDECPSGATCSGNDGGSGGYNNDAGGGGGAGAPGSLGVNGGAGGAGKTSSITGTDVVYAAGGAGFMSAAPSASGIGGVGNASGTPAANGRDGTGSGSGSGSGAQGGSGVVIVRYVVTSANACIPLTYTSGDYTVLEFQGAGTCSWTVPSGVTHVDALLVAGGGAGGGGIGGGGGGGEVVTLSDQPVSGTESITVGVGGTGIAGVGGDGGDTLAFGFSVNGGGGGGWVQSGAAAGADGREGGSGGGGGGCIDYATAGSSVTTASGAGNAGGTGNESGIDTECVAGGGGGAGGTGGVGSGTVGGYGGKGLISSISGASVAYGGGGGGGINGYSGTGTASVGGSGGGGAGGPLAVPRAGQPGTDGLGAGGGGGSNTDDGSESVEGGDGGDGVVIVRYYTNPLSQAALTLTTSANPGTYGSAITLGTSGGTTDGAVSYSVTNGTASGCSESSGSLTSTSAGTCFVTATMAGSTEYAAVSSAQIAVTFGVKALTITGATASNKVYDGSTSATLDFSGASLSGVVSGDENAVAIDSSNALGTFASSSVANGVAVTVSGVSLSGTKASSYSVTQPSGLTADITSASRTLSFETTSYSKTYGADSFTVTAVPSAGSGSMTYSSSGSACTVNASTGEVSITGTGSCSISASVASDGTYDGAATTTSASVTVGKASLTVTASSHSVTFGDAVPLVTASYVGFVNGDSSSDLSSAPTCSTTYTTTSAASTAPATTCSGGADTNYSFTYVNGQISIAKASQSITFASLSPKTFGDAAFTVTASALTSGADNGNVVSFVSGSPLVCSVAGDASTVNGATSAVVTLLGAGTCEITASQAGTTNYEAATDVIRNFSVAKRSQADVVLTNADTFVWGDDITLAATGGSGNGAVSFGVTGGTSGCSVDVSSGVVSYTQAGSCEVTAQRAGDANHLVSATESQSIVIGRAGQSVTFTSVVPATPLPGGTYSPTVTATSGLAPVLTITTGGGVVCSLSSGVVSFSATGSCTVAADQAGDARFSAAAQQVQMITVGALNQSISIVAPDDVDVGAAAFVLDTSASSGLAVSVSSADTDVCTVSGVVVTPIAVGTCELSVSQAGDDRFAAAATATTTFDVRAVVPSAAFITSVSGGDGAVTVGFTEPAFTGGVDLAAYRVTATSDGGVPVVDDSCVASPCTVSGLANGTEYTVTVASRNSVGLGAVSNVSPAVTPATGATAVRTLSAVPFDGGLTLSWIPPSVFGGGTFSSYEIRLREVGADWSDEPIAEVTSSVSTQRTLTGLTNGTAYEVQVVTITTANGAALVGNTTELTSVPVTVPGAPGVAAVNRVAPRDVDLSWSAPSRDGGATVTGYAVTVTDDNGEIVTCADVAVAALTRSGSCVLRGLDLAGQFEVSVAAVNRVGAGGVSSVEFSTPSFPVPETEPVLPPEAECPPCVLDADGNPLPNDVGQSAPGAQPGRSEISIGDVSVVVDASWVDADGVSVLQLPDVATASGTGALATSVVTVYHVGELVGDVRVDDDGTWELELEVEVAGTLVISMVDAAGDALVVTHPIDVVDTTGASGPRTPAGGEAVLPDPGEAVVLGPHGELLDGDVTVDADGVTVRVDGVTVTLRPTADTRTVVDDDGRLIVFDDARMRVGAAQLLAGSSIVVFLDGQRVGAVTVNDGGTVDTTLAFVAPDETTSRVMQVDVTGADTVARSVAVGYLHAVPSLTQMAGPSVGDACSPCVTGPDGETIDADVTMSNVGEVPGSITIGDGTASVTAGAGNGTGAGDGEATTWVNADGTLMVQTPGALALSGADALAGTTVTIYVDGVVAGTATVADDGRWVLALDLPAGTDGPTRITIGYTNADGSERVIILDVDVVATGETASGPRVPEGGTTLTPGAGNAQVLTADGELLDATYVVVGDSVEINVGETTIGVTPDAARGTVTSDGRIVVTLPAQIRVTGQGMVPGAVATVWVMSDPQLLGTVRIATDGTIDTLFDLPNDMPAGEHTIQIDTAGSSGERLSVAVGFEITAGTLPVTGVHADLVLAWAVLVAAAGALIALTAMGRRRTALSV